MMEDYILVGLVRKVRGNKGDLKVESLSDVSSRFINIEKVLLRKRDSKEVNEYIVEKSEPVNDYVVLKLQGVNSFDEASPFVGSEILIPESERGTLPGGSYFIDLLIGMNVRDLSGKKVGAVSDVRSTLAQSLLVVARENGTDFAIPFVKEFVKEIDTGKNEITVQLIEGMVEGGINEN